MNAAILAESRGSRGDSELGRRLFHVAWMSIALGIFLEVLLLLLAFAMGASKGGGAFLAGLVQKVTWSTIVCAGLAVGAAASKVKAPAMGLMGLLTAPLAFTAAKAAHKSLAQALSLVAVTGGPSSLLLASLKAVQYAALGSILALLSRKMPVRLSLYLCTGLAAGVIFGGMIIGAIISAAPKPLPAPELIARSLNELIFPVGCSLVLYAAEAFGKRAAH